MNLLIMYQIRKLPLLLLALAALLPGLQHQAVGSDGQKEIETMLKIGVPEGANQKPSSGETGEAELPRVLLIGDSISGGYTGMVQSHLKGIAVVQRGQNGGPTTKGLEILDDILGDQPWDVIHFNWGLHDMTWQFRMKPEERGVKEYGARLEQLVQRLKKTDAQLIWATTTPWPDNYAYFEKRFGRKLLYPEAEEKKWLDAARRVMEKHDIPINDLHALLKPDLETYQKSEDVHFNKDGSRAMAKQIAEAVRPYVEK